MDEATIKGINGARPHFVRKRTFSYRKWGLAPFIPYSLRQARVRKREQTPFFFEYV